MESQDVQVFEDPGLKRAIRRCCAGECASSRLKERLRETMRGEMLERGTIYLGTAGIGTAGIGLGGRTMPAITPAARVGAEAAAAAAKGLSFASMWPGFAVAAMFAVSVGTIILSYSTSSPSTTNNHPLAALPAAFEEAAISRHDHCCQAADHHAKDIPQAPYVAIGNYLRNQLHHPVLAANLEADQWRFRGAAICPVGDVKAAHLVFSKDDGETVSVFSLPANAFPQFPDHETYGDVKDGHVIVARMQDGALYCLVGHSNNGKLKEQDLDGMLAAHLGEASVAAGNQKAGSIAGALWVGRE